MSIAVVVKVHDGVVLASDSAATLSITDQQGRQGVINVYNNADKTFNLVKNKPIGMISWGFGGIGGASISTLAKDLRRRFEDQQDDWFLKDDYTLESVSKKVRDFYEEKYQPVYRDAVDKPYIFFFLAGYSSKSEAPEVWQIQIGGNESLDPIKLKGEHELGTNWGGQIEAINRLIKGIGVNFPAALKELGVLEEEIEPATAKISLKLETPLLVDAMPIQDAIDLAHFLVKTTIEYIRFSPGAPTVGGPIEVAAITKHEGFKWIQRKHYYDQRLNPKIEGDKDVKIRS